MTKELDGCYEISLGDTEIVSIDYSYNLDEDELLTGTPTVVEVTSTDLTLGNKAVSTVEYTDKKTGNRVGIGEAVQFSVLSADEGEYVIAITVSTDATIARTFKRNIRIVFK